MIKQINETKNFRRVTPPDSCRGERGCPGTRNAQGRETQGDLTQKKLASQEQPTRSKGLGEKHQTKGIRNGGKKNLRTVENLHQRRRARNSYHQPKSKTERRESKKGGKYNYPI